MKNQKIYCTYKGISIEIICSYQRANLVFHVIHGIKRGDKMDYSTDCIMTYSKKLVNPYNIQPGDIDIEDIAHSLSLTSRANGHFKHFYSVAQHSINCAIEAKNRGYGTRVQLACLLHDASESYIADVRTSN